MNTTLKNMQARIPADLHAWLKMQAIREGTTLGDLVYRELKKYRDMKERETEVFQRADVEGGDGE